MKDISNPGSSVDDCRMLDEGGSKMSQRDSLCETLKSSSTESLSSSSTAKSTLDETLDDFQENVMESRVKSKLAAKNQEDLSFICIMCQKDFTHLTLDERTMHVNQCIDYHSSAVATSQTIEPAVFVLECPLCFKQQPSNEARTAHVKKCGKSRGLSYQSVIQAIQLQEKHALERKALGLPLNVKAKPVKPPKKPVAKTFSLEPKSSMQSDLQLAKALSLSLKNKDTSSQLTFIPTTNEDVSIGILKAPAEFQNPGRPPSKKKKKINPTSLLLMRTEEERKKLIQDKVDAIIALTHKPENKLEKEEHFKSTSERNAAHLWNLSSETADKSLYYVDQLLDWIQPSDIEVGSKLCNLSQIPGHRIFTQLPCDYTFSGTDKHNESGAMVENNPPSSLSNSLRSLIGNSWMSDVDIHTASGIVIPAHKLFLALRCPLLKNAFDEPVECGKYILNWENTSFDAALHFLNFIYTGSTEWKEEVIEELTQLARKYQVEDLLTILDDSKTLEMLIGDDMEDEKSTILPMDTDCHVFHTDSGVAECSTLEDNHSLPQTKQTVLPNSEQAISISSDKHLKEDNDIEISFSSVKEAGFNADATIRNNLSSPSSTNSAVETILEKVALDISKDNIETIKTKHCNPDLETYIIDSNSSDDSCKVLKSPASSDPKVSPAVSWESTTVKLSPKPTLFSVRRSLNQTPPSTSKCFLEENYKLPDVSYHNLSRMSPVDYNSNQEKLASTRSEDEKKLDDNSNEDIFIVKEFFDKIDSTPKRNSLSMDNTLPLRTGSSRKLSSFSSVFHNEYDDLDAAICLSQNTSFQDQKISRVENWRCEQSPVAFQNDSYTSPDQFSFSQNGSERHFSPFKSTSYNGSSKKVCDEKECEIMDNDCEIVSSPEILVCDSDEENADVLGRSYFKNQGSSSQKISSPPINKLRTSFPTEIKNFVDDRFHSDSVSNCNFDSTLLSQFKKNDTEFSFQDFGQHESISENVFHSDDANPLQSPKRLPNSLNETVPELICFDPNSDDKLEVAKSPQSSNNISNSFKEVDCISSKPNEQLKTSPCRNLLFSSPESPWTFKSKKLSDDFELPKKTKTKSCSAAPKEQSSNIPQKNSDGNHPKNSSLEILKSKSTNSTITTPKDLVKFKISESPITPFPDYKNMVTPEIKEALKRIGVKALPRKKAVAVLSHIYDETHPWNEGVPGTSRQDLESASQSKPKILSQKKTLSLPKKRKETTDICEREPKKKVGNCGSSVQEVNKVQDKATKKTTQASKALPNAETNGKKEAHTSNTSPESIKNFSFGSSNSGEGEAHNLSISSEFSDSGIPECKESTERMKNYILSNNDLYTKILNYTPINLVEFQQELKENGIKIGIKQLTDYLDEQCITFTYPRKEEYKKKQQARTQRFRKKMIAKLSQKQS